MRIFLNSDVSTVVRGGPVKDPRATFPNVPESGSKKALGSKYRPVFLNSSTPRITFPLKLGFKLGTSGLRLSPFPDRLEPTVGVNGKPPVALKIAFHCQPPISFSTQPVAPLPNALPFPKGRAFGSGATGWEEKLIRSEEHTSE